MKTKDKSLEESILDLYLNLKIRKNDEFNIENEKEKLKSIDSKLILDYIKSSIDILINYKVDERFKAHNAKIEIKENLDESIQRIDEFEPINEYENALRHLEAEIRNHIKIEHQLKLHSETLQARVEELEKSKDEYKQKVKGYQEVNIIMIKQLGKYKNGSTDTKEVELLRSENNNLKLLIKSYEDRNNIIIELEKKLRSQQARYEKEVKELETAYKEKIKSYLRINLNKNSANSKKNLANDEEHSRNINLTTKLDNNDKLHTKTTTSAININQISHRASSVTERKKDNSVNNAKRTDKNNVKFIIDEIKEQKNDIFLKQKTTVIDSGELPSSKISKITNIHKESADSSDISSLYIPKTHRKVESSVSNEALKANTKHNRNYSFDKTSNKSHISSVGNNQSGHISNVNPQSNQKPAKKIYEMKDKHSNNTKSVPNSSLHSNKVSMVNLNSNNSSIFNNANQINVPLINNINIYAANMNNFKSNDINVRQYIFNKINKPKPNPKHARSSSVTNQ